MTDPKTKYNWFTSIKDTLQVWKSTIITLLVLFIGRGYFIDYSPVPSESMSHNLLNGDLAIVNKMSYFRLSPVFLPFIGRFFEKFDQRVLGPGNIKPGDMVVFFKGDKFFTKRVIGLPGDLIEIDGDNLKINGESTIFKDNGDTIYPEESYILAHDNYVEEKMIQRTSRIKRGDGKYTVFKTLFSKSRKLPMKIKLRVPEGKVFLMGDNRDNSYDSRFYYFGMMKINQVIGKVQMILFGSTAKFENRCTWLQTEALQHVKGDYQRWLIAWVQFIVEFPYSMVKRYIISINFRRFNTNLYKIQTLEESNAEAGKGGKRKVEVAKKSVKKVPPKAVKKPVIKENFSDLYEK